MNAPDKSDQSDRLLPAHGGYRKLRSFQAAQIAYDATVLFCERFLDQRSRTCDQMIQAARSGVQNIAEGSMASGTSKKTELKLTNVARASLEELLLDYQDFLRQRRLRLWDKNSPEALAVRGRYLSDTSNLSDSSDSSEKPDPTAPCCPCCGKPMLWRTARKGPRAGRPFWGCSAYPDCTGTRPVNPRA